MTTRRKILKSAVALGGLATFAAGFTETATKAFKGLTQGTSGDKPHNNIFGNAPEPEYKVNAETGKLELNPDQQVSFTMCQGCNTMCSLRIRSDKKTGKILRVAGNPFHPLSADAQVPFKTSVRDALLSTTRKDDSGLAHRSTACGRGNAVLSQIDSPYRVLKCLKRDGPRGSGKWKSISFEKLIEEVCDGGDLFGEGKVEGLKAIHDLKTPLDPKNPEYGPKANQLAVVHATGDGRNQFIKRFAFNCFGTRNYGHHGSYCGFSMRAGSGAVMGDFKKFAHGKPDFEHTEFAIFLGTSPGNAGKPFKRIGRMVAEARTDGKMKYIVVDPILTNASSYAARDRNHWLPIKPGTDAALAMGMIRWIIDNKRYDDAFLTAAGPNSAKAINETTWSNACHLVNTKTGAFLRGKDMGWTDDEKKAKAFVVLNSDGKPVPHGKQGKATLFYQGDLSIPVKTVAQDNADDTASSSETKTIAVKTSMQILKEEAQRFTLEEYAKKCGIDAKVIEGLAKEFTSHGKKAAINTHGGMMSSNGFYTAWAVLMLNALIGNWNWKGGVSISGKAFPSFGKGPRYNFKKFPGKVKPKGIFLSRSKFPYKKTSEFKRRKAAGESPYPTKAPWYPLSPPIYTEYLTSHFDGYPYKLKALISFMANPLYGQAGLNHSIGEKMKDPKQLGLHIAIDGYINESSALADYIVPDSVMYEAWGWAMPWNGTVTKTSTARWPVLEPRQDKTADGDTITMEMFFIAVGKRLGLPGFGDKVIPDSKGNLHPLNRPEDWYLRAGANIAFVGKKPVPDASDDDIEVSGVSRIMDELKKTLKPEEIRKVAYLYARGGRMEDYTKAYKGEHLTRAYKKPLQIYNEKVGRSINTMSGKRFVGVPTWYPQQFADGTPLTDVYPESEWPLRITSVKSNLQSSYSITSPRLRQIMPNNPISINPQDAEKAGIQSGDKVRIITPQGSAIGTALVRKGIIQGAIAIPHGYGHWELGARPHQIDGVSQPENPSLAAGVSLNKLGLLDVKRGGHATLGDWVVGAAARQALPARIEKV